MNKNWENREWANLVRRRKRTAREHGLHCEPRVAVEHGSAWALFIETTKWSPHVTQGTGVHLMARSVHPPGHARRPLWYSEKVTTKWYELLLYVPGQPEKLLLPCSSFASACWWAKEILPKEAAAWRLGAAG